MNSIKNNLVTKELEKLLQPLKKSEPAQYDIIMALLDDVYDDPKIHQPEGLTKGIEDKLYRMIDEHVKYNLTDLKDKNGN